MSEQSADESSRSDESVPQGGLNAVRLRRGADGKYRRDRGAKPMPQDRVDLVTQLHLEGENYVRMLRSRGLTQAAELGLDYVEGYLAQLNPTDLGPMSVRLGVSVESLDALDVGLQREGISTWPMRDHLGRAIGIRRRFDPSGAKRAITGSRNGLFLPRIDEQTLVLITEGESDCAAALTLGCFAIGRPGCQGGIDHLVRWLRHRPGRDIVILADEDGPGVRGAGSLAGVLVALARSVRVVVGPRGWKDLRAAVVGGYTRVDLLQDIAATPPVRAAIHVVISGGRP